MDVVNLHADRTLPALVDGATLPWIPSPEPGVDRRLLERSGGEVAIASSIVRYCAGSRFPKHLHEFGEEFYVLEGTFSDEDGDYPAGTYVRNPRMSAHAPFSREGCVLFVKLRQMSGDENDRVRVRPENRAWRKSNILGHEVANLYDNGRVCVTLERLSGGTALPSRTVIGGEEVFVIEGSADFLGEESERLNTWTWSRHPGTRQPAMSSNTGAMLWVKRGHLS